MSDQPSRRQFFLITAGSVAAATLAACKSGGSAGPAPLACSDVSALAPADLQVRITLGYEERSTDPLKKCTNCLQWVAGPPSACGSCKVVKGPINPEGNCKAWVAKPPA